MNIDVSEIKTYRACKRQWKLSSRNAFHLRPIVTPPAFAFGTIFHEALHMMYLNVPLEKVMDMVRREMDPENDLALLAMVPGYYDNVLPGDLEKYQVLDIEWKFKIPMPFLNDVNVCGSIDMIVLDKETNKIYGFEHKTAKAFRDDSFLWMDEQPRVYTWALQTFVAQYNEKHPEAHVTLGGVFINEVKKLLRKFDYKRSLCVYSESDLRNFMNGFFTDCKRCHHDVETDDVALPQPSYMGCKMCNFATICQTYMYGTLDKDVVMDEFKEEFKEREFDHLEEKVERVAEQ